MIPQRSFYGVNFGNGIRIRVSACRKRLRVARVAHRTDLRVSFDQQPPTPVADSSEVRKGGAAQGTSSFKEEAERA